MGFQIKYDETPRRARNLPRQSNGSAAPMYFGLLLLLCGAVGLAHWL